MGFSKVLKNNAAIGKFFSVLRKIGAGDGQGSLVCSSPWGHKESDTTEGLNNNNNLWETYLTSLNLSLLHDKMETINSHFTEIGRMK